MLVTSRNAHDVLRLVLRQANTQRQVYRSVGTVSLENVLADDTSPSTDSTLFIPHPTTAPPSDAASFLEDDMTEYDAAKIVLPPRDFRPRPLEWPTLRAPKQQAVDFASNTGPGRPHPPESPRGMPVRRPAQRDLMGELALKGDFDGARQLYPQLKAIKARMTYRQVYFQPALAALERDDLDSFFFWLELYPNRPATPNNPQLKRQWAPVIARMLGRDPETIYTFLEVAGGRKGLNPTVLVPLMVHLQHRLPPAQVRRKFEDILDTYRRYTSSSTSTSKRAAEHKAMVDKQVQGWWNVFLRKWILLGSRAAALELYEKPPTGLKWEEFTETLAREQLLGGEISLSRPFSSTSANPLKSAPAGQSAMVSRMWPRELSPTGKWTLLPLNRRDMFHQLPGRVRSALSYQEPASRLAEVIQLLRRMSGRHHTALARFESRYCSKAIYGYHGASKRRLKWDEALLIIHRKHRADQAAVRTFQQSYIWLGLPDHPCRSADWQSGAGTRLRHPTIKVINAVFPALIRLLPRTRGAEARGLDTDIHAFHRIYLDLVPTLPLALRPNDRTHTVIIDTISRLAGPVAGVRALTTMLERGFTPPRAAYLSALYVAAIWEDPPVFREILRTIENNEHLPSHEHLPNHRDLSVIDTTLSLNEQGEGKGRHDIADLGSLDSEKEMGSRGIKNPQVLGLKRVEYYKLAKFWARRDNEDLANKMLLAAQGKGRVTQAE